MRELHRHTDDEVARVIAIHIRQRHVRGRHAKAREVERDVDGRLEDAHVAHEGADQGASVERVEAGEERAGLAERGQRGAEVNPRLRRRPYREGQRGAQSLLQLLLEESDEVLVGHRPHRAGRNGRPHFLFSGDVCLEAHPRLFCKRWGGY